LHAAFWATFLQHGVAALLRKSRMRYANCYAVNCTYPPTSIELDDLCRAPMNTGRNSRSPDLKSTRSEAGHRKLARWAVGLAAFIVLIAIAALFARFVAR
jgi:hypothetical protein